MGEVANVYDGTHQTPNYVAEGVPFISVEDIREPAKTTKRISREDFEKFKVKATYDDIIMTRIGDVGTTTIIKESCEFAFYVSLSLVRVNKNISPDFLRLAMDSPYFQNELWRRTIHVAFPKKINLNEISECKISFPHIDEQVKIAKMFDNISVLKKSLDKKLELLKLLKKGLENKILESISEIETRKLSDYCNITTGRCDANEATVDGDYKFFTCSTKDYRINKYSFDCEAILIAGNGDVGHTKYYKGKFDAYQRTYVLFDFTFDVNFLKVMIDILLPAKVKKETNNGAMPFLKISTISDLEIPAANNGIMNFIFAVNKVDSFIEKTETYISKTENLKVILLKKMFV